MSTLSEWRLASQDGQVGYSLPYTMVFIGRADCDINIQDERIDRRHALVTFDHYQSKFKVKDLGTSGGTYINDKRIPDQTFITIEEGDLVKLGRDCVPLCVERCADMTATTAAILSLTQSRSLDKMRPTSSNTSISSHSGDEHASLSRSNSRPKWDQRLFIAECQGCIREQDLHHTCGANSEHTHSAEEARSSPVSPLAHLHLRTQAQSTAYQSPDHRISTQTRMDIQDYRVHDDTAPLSYTDQYEDEAVDDPQTYTSGGQLPRKDAAVSADTNIAAKRGTPLYGQPSWWGESGADDHNKKLLQDMQQQIIQEKQTQKNVEESRHFLASTLSRSSPARPVASVEAGGDPSKGLSFTVDLVDSLDEELSAEPEPLISKLPSDKLSNFLPENLRKSIRDRKERRISLTADKNQSEVTHSPVPSRRSKSPHRTQHIAGKDSTKATSSPDNSSMYLINKMLYSSPKGHTEVADTDDPTEYSMYSEAKVMNRSSTMPELIQSHGAPQQVMAKSKTSDTLVHADNGDKVSESGTYTIDEDNTELEQARQDIDQLFGIRSSPSHSPGLEIRESADNLLDTNGSLQVEIGSTRTEDTYTVGRTNSGKNEDTIYTTERILEDQIAYSPTNNNDIVKGKPPLSPTSRTRSPERCDDSPLQQRSSSTGRKLPAVPRIPKKTDDLRLSTEVSVGRSNTMPRRKKEVEHSKEKILQELGIGDTPVIEKERPKLVEELLTSRTYHRDNDPIIVNKTTLFDKIISSTAPLSPEQSSELPQYSAADPGSRERVARGAGRASIDSVNTDVLLQSTDEFMKAIHSFSSAESDASNRPSASSKPATKSTTRQSNSLRKTTSERLSSSTRPTNGHEIPAPRSASTSKEPSATRRSVADSVTARLSGARRGQTSRDSDSNEGSLESLNNSKNLSSSRVGPLSSTRPNRTFDLRRARTESMESDTSSTPRTNGTRTAGRSARSLDNSEVSLGAKIVQRCRENGAVMEPSTASKAPIRRTDGGRYSMRATSSTNRTANTKYTGSSSGSMSSSGGPAKSAGTKKLPSRPSSNSMIAKAEREKEASKDKEKAAWDRRRTYDPRRAVQQAKAKKSDSRGGTPSSNDDSSACSTNRPRANSYSGENASIVHNAPTTLYNEASDTRHSADVFQPMESNSLKLNLHKEGSLEDSSHELEIAQLSHCLAKDLEMMSSVDNEAADRFHSGANQSREKISEPSPETQELIESMFACQQQQQQQQKSAFSSYRSVASVTPEMSSPALSPMKKKLSSSQNLENGSPSTVDHSYNSLVLTSIQRMSGKLHSYTSNTVNRLRERGVSLSATPSPTDEMRGDDMPANTTLASILKTLKQVERNCKVMDNALFTSIPQSELSTVGSNEHEHYLAEIKKIRNEIAGFRPIEDSADTKPSKIAAKFANSNSKPTVNKSRTTNNTAKTVGSTYKQRAVYY